MDSHSDGIAGRESTELANMIIEKSFEIDGIMIGESRLGWEFEILLQVLSLAKMTSILA